MALYLPASLSVANYVEAWTSTLTPSPAPSSWSTAACALGTVPGVGSRAGKLSAVA
jgi:hypothetical protein